jgi:hypothetical protein
MDNVAARVIDLRPESADDFGADEVSQEEQARRAEEARQEKLQQFGGSLAKTRDEWIAARSANGQDRRWVEDMDQYRSQDAATRHAVTMMDAVERGGAAPAKQQQLQTRSTVFIALTRSKTDAAEANLADILLPVEDKNWGIAPTPNPRMIADLTDQTPELEQNPETGEMTPRMGPLLDDKLQPVIDPETGQPKMVKYTKSEVARGVSALARQCAEAMEREIDDQLTECAYNDEVRKVLHWAAVLGTGVLKGPMVTSRSRRAWVPKPATDEAGRPVMGKDGKPRVLHVLKYVKETQPASFACDPRLVWPDPSCGTDPQNGRGVIEMEEMTPKRVRELAKQPGFMKEQLAQVLMEGPKAASDKQTRWDKDFQHTGSEKNFEVWTYTGEVELDDLRAAQAEGLPDEDDINQMDEAQLALMSLSAVVVLINSTVVKVHLNPNEAGDLPYDFFPWVEDLDSVWGYGLPYVMRAQQRIMNAAWRQMMDNAAVTAGDMLFIRRKGIKPADGQMVVQARKIWYVENDVEDVDKAVKVVSMQNHQPELQAIIEMAKNLADEETGSPMLMQGERGNAPETVGGMQMLMNSANVVKRRLVKSFDAKITKRHLTRYYDFNMAYSPKDEIKGDYSVKALGSSALLIRDIQNQAMLGLAQTAAAVPQLDQRTDWPKLYKGMLKAQHLNPEDIMKDEDTVKRDAEQAAKNAPQDPRIQAAQMQQQTEQLKIEAAAKEGQMDRELRMLELSASQQVSVDSIKSQLAQTAIKTRSEETRQANELVAKNKYGTGI